MHSTPHILANTGVVSGGVSMFSAIISLSTALLPVAQLGAAFIGMAAGIVSISWIAWQWNHQRKHKRK